MTRYFLATGLAAASFCLAAAALGSAATAQTSPFPPALVERLDAGPVILAQRRTCRSVSSCREAVALWCGGYRRADGDNDGVPCETVCRSRAQVDQIRREIGC